MFFVFIATKIIKNLRCKKRHGLDIDFIKPQFIGRRVEFQGFNHFFKSRNGFPAVSNMPP
jgi:hypothetical protein